MNTIRLSGLRGETLLGFLAALGTLRMLSRKLPEAKLSWCDSGSGWVAELSVPQGTIADAEEVSAKTFTELEFQKDNHPVLNWRLFLGKAFSDESDFFRKSAESTLAIGSPMSEEYAPVFSSQIPVVQGDILEHFDHPFRAARKDYYVGNLESVLQNTTQSHIQRTLVRPWDYGDAMANQSLRLDHGDDRRHAYQWYAPTEDPARQKVGCMLGANRLAIEAFPLFPCIPTGNGNTAIGFIFNTKTYTWVTWPIWKAPCSLSLIQSLLNLSLIHELNPSPVALRQIGISAVLRSRRLPIEKNKVFLPPVSLFS